MSKKASRSLNHLLNFRFDEEVSGETGTHSHSKFRGGGKQHRAGHGCSMGRGRLSRKGFVAASFRFALSPSTRLRGVVGEGESEVEWNEVESVLQEVETECSCPICLETVKLGRMTTCGHTFCWLCIARFFRYSEEKWARCPLCFSFIQISDLKRVEFLHCDALPIRGKEVDFKYMYRYSSCIVSMPVPETDFHPSFGEDGESDAKCEFPLSNDQSTEQEHQSEKVLLMGPPRWDRLPIIDEPAAKYSRLCLETNVHKQSMIRVELAELQNVKADALAYGDSLGVELIEHMVQSLLGEFACLDTEKDASISLAKTPIEGLEPLAGEPMSFSYHLPGCANAFLHPFNLKCLIVEYGDKLNLPVSLRTLRVVDVETMNVTKDAKKRYSFLSHIPDLATFHFIEVDLGRYISEGTKEKFKDAMKNRQKRRQARMRAEKIFEKSVQDKINSQWSEQLAAARGGVGHSTEFVNDDLVINHDSDVDVLGSSPISSFAAIVSNHGHFPDLREALTLSPPMSKSAPSASKVPWGGKGLVQKSKASSAGSSGDLGLSFPLPFRERNEDKDDDNGAPAGGKKKKSKKKVMLFSNAQVYRS